MPKFLRPRVDRSKPHLLISSMCASDSNNNLIIKFSQSLLRSVNKTNGFDISFSDLIHKINNELDYKYLK